VGELSNDEVSQIDYMNPKSLVVSMSKSPVVAAQIYKPDLMWYVHNILLASEERQEAFASVFQTKDNQSLTNHIVSRSTRQKYSRGDFIYLQEELSKGVVFLVVKGEVQLELYSQKETPEFAHELFGQNHVKNDLQTAFSSFYGERGQVLKKPLVTDPTALNSLRRDIRVCPAGSLLGLEMLNLGLAGYKVKANMLNKKYICTARVLTADSVVYKLRIDYIRRLDGILGRDRWNKFREFVHRTVTTIQRQLDRHVNDCRDISDSDDMAIAHLDSSLVDSVIVQVTRHRIPEEPELAKMDLSKYDHGK
jgi:hypothetical protein